MINSGGCDGGLDVFVVLTNCVSGCVAGSTTKQLLMMGCELSSVGRLPIRAMRPLALRQEDCKLESIGLTNAVVRRDLKVQTVER